MSKYNAKSHTLFGKIQAATGTPATLGDTDAIAALNLTQNVSTTTEEYIYAGLLSREVETDITDQTREISFEAFFPSAGGVAGTDATLWNFFEACGAGHVLSAGVSSESTNAVPSADVMTFEYYKHNTAGTHKKVIMSDASGIIDLSMEIGKRAMFSCKFQGNYAESIQEGAGRVADFGSQKENVAMRITKDTLVTVKLQPLATGEPAVNNFNICFGSLTSTNHFGFSLERYLLSCEEGFSTDPVAGEVKLIILEDDADATYNPEDHWLGHHSLEVVWGGGAGKEQRVFFEDLQLKDIQDTTLGAWRGQELTFSNVKSSSNIIR